MSKSLGGAAENLSRIQEMADELAHQLGRSVEVDTPSFEVVCASAQIGAIDERRIASIIHRSPPPEPVPWLLSYGIREAEGPVRLPANPDYGMLPRVCFPVRARGTLLAYLWLFDEPRLSDAEIAQVEEFTTPLAELFRDGDSAAGDQAAALAALAADILAGTEGTLARAQEGGHLPGDGQLTLHVIRLRDAGDDAPAATESDPARRLQLELGRLHRHRPFLVTTEADALLVLERARSAADTARVLDEVRRAGIVTASEVAAVGSAHITGPDLARPALRRARFMSDVAVLPGHHSGQLAWEDAGAWRLLYGWELSDATVPALSEDAHRLILAGGRSHWSTLLCYLDNARNTTLTSEQLFIHRATLHYRLERVREITGGAALDDGWRAAALHAALRLHAGLRG